MSTSYFLALLSDSSSSSSSSGISSIEPSPSESKNFWMLSENLSGRKSQNWKLSFQSVTSNFNSSIASMIFISYFIGNLNSSELLHLPGSLGHQHNDWMIFSLVKNEAVRLVQWWRRERNLKIHIIGTGYKNSIFQSLRGRNTNLRNLNISFSLDFEQSLLHIFWIIVSEATLDTPGQQSDTIVEVGEEETRLWPLNLSVLHRGSSKVII